MIDELNAALETYEQKWQKLISVRHERQFFAGLQPTAVGWKVEDREEYDKRCAELHDVSDKVIETWMNERWVAKFHLKDSELSNGATIVKVMQRRPGSSDDVGLDHVDFYTPDIRHAESVLKGEEEVQWSWESNDVIDGYDWLSIWFNDTEAKIKADTVLDIIQAELKELSQKIIAS